MLSAASRAPSRSHDGGYRQNASPPTVASSEYEAFSTSAALRAPRLHGGRLKDLEVGTSAAVQAGGVLRLALEHAEPFGVRGGRWGRGQRDAAAGDAGSQMRWRRCSTDARGRKPAV